VAGDPFTACAEQLSTTPRLVRQLLDDHVPTTDGWCRAHNGHAERHPCSIRQLAELARAHLLAARPVAGSAVPPQRTAVGQ
jgi:hypothetical protein